LDELADKAWLEKVGKALKSLVIIGIGVMA
jgi:hypothetical protein